MNHDDGPDQALFGRLRPPEPPAELRDRVLHKATEALLAAPARDPWGALWKSWLARLAWASCVVLLIIAHLAVTPREAAPSMQVNLPFVVARSHASEDLEEILRLPRLRGEGRSRLGSLDLEANHIGPAEAGQGEAEP